MGSYNTSSEAEIRRILARACELRELLMLVTPYMRFASNFVALEGDVAHARVTMGAEESMYGLRSPDLRIRFPEGVHFLEGRTRLLGFGLWEGRRTLRLALPKALQDDDQRQAHRVSRMPRVEATLSTPRYEFRSASIANISVTGACLQVAFEAGDAPLNVGDIVAVSLPLEDALRVDGRAVICWTEGRQVGLKFDPPLGGQTLPLLSRWIFMKREEEKNRVEALKDVTGASAANPSQASGARAPLLLLSASEAVEGLLKEALPETPFQRIPATGAALKDFLKEHPQPPVLLFHVFSTGLDDRRRLKGLLDIAGTKAPFVLLGTLPDPAPLFDLGTELKAAAVYDLGSRPGPFLQRLIQGILRRHRGESVS